jgi:hypothetical protein
MINNIIWQTTKGDYTEFELEYLREFLFKDITYNAIFDENKCETILDNSLIVYSCDEPELYDNLKQYLRKYDELGYTYYLLHLSNERLNHNYEYYVRAKHVFRGYYDERIKLDNVTTIPIGFKSGFLNKSQSTRTVFEKEYVWTFIGQLKNDREVMYNTLVSVEPNFVHLTSTWNCPTSLSVKDIIALYEKTIFIPCPHGWVNSLPESFRILEALEWGCLPILKRYNNLDYYENIFGKHPFIIVNDWAEAYNRIIELCSDFDKLEQYRNQVCDFYNNYKRTLREEITLLATN